MLCFCNDNDVSDDDLIGLSKMIQWIILSYFLPTLYLYNVLKLWNIYKNKHLDAH